MRKVLYLGFCMVLLAGFGCAITDYGIITDNNQITGKMATGVNPVINTKGKAHIQETSQVATIWPDGTDELLNFVKQRSDGTATLYTYNNFSTGNEPTFHDDLYCNTDRQGCSIYTAPDNNDGNLFDGVTNLNCSGARSLSVLLATGRYYGECGNREAKLGVEEKFGLFDTAVGAKAFGRKGLMWRLDSSNTSITVQNSSNGMSYNVPLFGATIDHFMSNHENVAFTWLDHAMIGVALRDFANKLDNELNSSSMVISLSHNGVTSQFVAAGGAHSGINSKVWRLRANTSF